MRFTLRQLEVFLATAHAENISRAAEALAVSQSAASGLPPTAAQAMSSVVFAGSAQFVATQLIATDAPSLVLLLTTLVVNLRHMLYSASVAPFVRPLPRRWKWLLAYLLTDEAYAVAIPHYREPSDQAGKHWCFLGAGLALWAVWQASTAVGIFLGAQVPPSWSLDFTLPLTFIALVLPALMTGLAESVFGLAGQSFLRQVLDILQGFLGV